MPFEFELGFLGGGQLARMSIQAAQRMGLQCLSLDESENTPASQIAASTVGSLHDPEAIAEIFRACMLVTLENEFVPAASIRRAAELAGREPDCIIPGIETLEIIQDKLKQRKAMTLHGIPGPRAIPIDDDGTLAVATLGFPMVLKSRFGGYDGHGTRIARTLEDFEDLKIHWAGGGWLAEDYVPFRREIAVMVYRTAEQIGCFPTMETVQTDNVCDLVFPCDSNATGLAMNAVRAVEGYGLFGVECFETERGDILLNEIAPRPHNSGHYTLDWGGISQFEVHIRAVLGLPIPEPDGVPAAMANLLGVLNPGAWQRGLVEALTQDPEVHVHWYGKVASRPGRKMGHINAVGPLARERVVRAREAFYQAWQGQASPESESPKKP